MKKKIIAAAAVLILAAAVVLIILLTKKSGGNDTPSGTSGTSENTIAGLSATTGTALTTGTVSPTAPVTSTSPVTTVSEASSSGTMTDTSLSSGSETEPSTAKTSGATAKTTKKAADPTGPVQTVEYFSDFNDTRLAKFFKKYDMDNVYIKIQSEKNGVKAVREYGSKDGDAYSSLEDGENKIIYLSNGRITYSIDPKEKTYTVYALMPLYLSYVYDGCIGAGECEFDGKDCVYEAFYDPETGYIVCHLFDKNGNWLGYEHYEGTEIVQTDRVVTISKEIPSHIYFKIPEGYKYYYEETYVTWPSDWD